MPDRLGQGFRAVVVQRQAGRFIHQQAFRHAHRRGHQRQAVRGGFEKRLAEIFVTGGIDKKIGGPVTVGQGVRGPGAGELHALLDAQGAGPGLQFFQVAAAGHTAGFFLTADQRQLPVHLQQAERLQDKLEPPDPGDAPDEQEPEWPRPLMFGRGAGGQIDPHRNDPDFFPVDAEFQGVPELGLRGNHHGVGAPHGSGAGDPVI